MAFQHIRVASAPDGILEIILNRPEKLNALNARVMSELDEVVGAAESDPAVRALLLSGAGEKAFAAGADIAELAAQSPLEAHRTSLRGQRILRRLEQLGKPSLAAINGHALGAGLELALACTIRVASANARLGMPEVRLGILPGYGGTQRLPHLIGRGRALEMMLTGEPIEAAEALRIGLVEHVVAQAELLDFSRRLLGKILRNAPLAARMILEAVDAGREAGLAQGFSLEAALFAQAAGTEDCREGLAAFLEKRQPIFMGK